MKTEDVLPDLRKLSFDFFHRFARMEFALKEGPYLKNSDPGSWALPDWDRFIGDWQDQYRPSADAIALVEAAPREQVVGPDGHSLEFRDVLFDANASDLKRVVKLARTVRNNLFHGGKHDAAGWDDAARISLLLPLSIAVLDELASLAGLGSDYEGVY
jgi:hypothetical protein